MEKDRKGIAFIKTRIKQKVENVLSTLASRLKCPMLFCNPLPQLVLFLFLCHAATTVAAHSRYSTVKIPVSCSTDRKERVDSLVRTLPGVFSASWSLRHHLIVVVYDRTQISRQRLMKALGVAHPQREEEKEPEKRIRAD